ncbi:iron complex transport system substrate-binding protein [Sediminihabitans luteus]|uniref:Iron complex transport system substrate-binding protein n=1 Tax=Sediminihabitans luteus TaxID=1138585 RepID=A0A2M9CEI6_9CELL|nr:iron-siderophore ABC transporter substrate-binding protein [Sediminihabitans luteus]PJJ70265.1 iron complex transport system substrate-binding protein [Sediminihabitans luteus]GII97736.1 ABC transporter substrate-binding protein [Sediminihabitans luteus]
MTRRTRTLVAATAAAALLTLTACSSSDDTTDAATDGASAGSADAAFPASVETKFGTVTVDEKPERVVALGWGDAETALALGVQPVGASDWLGFGGDGVGPWAEGLYDESPEIIETLEPSYEAIAALEPDLILDIRSSGDQERYDKLSSIATTIGVPEGGDSYLADADDQMEMISTALGVPEKGEQLLDEVDAAFDEATAAHPEWDGKTVTAATRTSEGWGAYVEESSRVEFLENLGFEQSPTIAEIPANAGGFSVDISSEQLDLLDADLIVAFPIWIETTEITEDPQWKAIPAVADDRDVVIDGDLSSAYSLGTSLATLYAIDNLVPLLEDATK